MTNPLSDLHAVNSNRLRALIFFVTLLSLASLGVVVSAEKIATSQPQTPSTEKTVEQVQKNIQVLKGLPQSRWFPR